MNMSEAVNKYSYLTQIAAIRVGSCRKLQNQSQTYYISKCDGVEGADANFNNICKETDSQIAICSLRNIPEVSTHSFLTNTT